MEKNSYEYYPTLMKCTDCNREFVFCVAGTQPHSEELSLCLTCFGTKFGLPAFKEKQIADIMSRFDEHTGLSFQFLWEIPYEDWSNEIKSRFKQPPPTTD